MSRKIARILRDLWVYFKAGHGGYLVYSLSIMNFVKIPPWRPPILMVGGNGE